MDTEHGRIIQTSPSELKGRRSPREIMTQNTIHEAPSADVAHEMTATNSTIGSETPNTSEWKGWAMLATKLQSWVSGQKAATQRSQAGTRKWQNATAVRVWSTESLSLFSRICCILDTYHLTVHIPSGAESLVTASPSSLPMPLNNLIRESKMSLSHTKFAQPKLEKQRDRSTY